MDKLTLEAAITELHLLLGHDDVSEAQFQVWFEKHAAIFTSYGYRTVIPHPELVTADGRIYIPDFLIQTLDGLWDIFEIKLADTQILKDVDRRQTFYASLESYYAQCREYAEFFDDSAHRSWFKRYYGYEVQKNPRSILVAGRNDGLDKFKVHQILSDRGSAVVLQTYDDIAERLEFSRVQQYGRFENLIGISLHTLLQVLPLDGQETYLFDIGISTDRNRVSIYVDEDGDLCLRVTESSGTPRILRARQQEGTFVVGVPIYLAFEVGVGNEHSILSIDVNGRAHSYLVVERDRLDLQLPLCLVMGSDVIGHAETHMNQFETALYDRTLRFAERYQLSGYFLEKRDSGFTQYVEFMGHNFLYSRGHPNFPSLSLNATVGASPIGGLIQDNPRARPRVRLS